MNKEDSQIIFQRYGASFALINAIESLLENLLYFNGGLKSIDKNISKKILKGRGMGSKLDLASDLIDPKLKQKIEKLNKKRIILAHYSFSIIEEHDYIMNQHKEFFAFTKGEDTHEISEIFFSEIIQLGNEIIKELSPLIKITD